MAPRIDNHVMLLIITLFCINGFRASGLNRRAPDEVGNKCYEDEPWPCKTPGYCIALEYICDGNVECPDGYDEDPKLCRAKQRPPKDAVASVITKSSRYLIPDILGDIKITRSAHLLNVAGGLDDYAINARLTEEQKENLGTLINAVRDNDKGALERLGIPLSAWNDLSWLFDKLLSSGFEA